jgi:hypothetical protein
MEDAGGEFGRGNRFAIMFDDYAAGEEFLGEKELLEGARELSFDLATVSGD